ncbi:MAG: MFS transporter [Candidatus Marinimicrobia bacterium]|nr:MFS transporter [Candidatus Neomarinimicrobiota bacterium]
MNNNTEKYIISLTGLGHYLVHCVTMILPAILILLESEYEISLVKLGTLVTTQFLFMGLGGLPAGVLVDRFGSKFILIIYFVGLSITCLWLYHSTSYLSFVIGMASLGLIAGLYHPAGLKIISHAQDVSRFMAYHGVFGSIGLATGPLFAAWVSNLYTWRMAYLGVAFVSCIGFILTLFYSEEKNENPQWLSLSVNLSHSHIILFTVSAIWGIAHHGVFNFLPYYFSERVELGFNPVSEGGILTGFVLLLGIFGQLFGGRIGSRYPRKSLLVWVVGLNIPFLILMTFSWGTPLIIFACMMGAVNFMFQPISNSLIADVSPVQGRGLIYGISFALSFGVGSFSGIICGYIGDYLQINMIFTSMAIILIPATIFAWLLKKEVKKS